MKIGIVTYHRAENFGAMLQAVALRNALEQLGHEAYFIDYWPEGHADFYKVWSLNEFKRRTVTSKMVYIAKNMLLWRSLHRRHNEFQHFFNKYIEPYCLPENSKVDLALYGSDQIWGRLTLLGNQLDAVYFGENAIQTAKHSSYAASMGNSTVNDEESEFLRAHLCKFDKVGVRERDVKELLDGLGLENVSINCDPTFLLSSLQWKSIIPAERLIKKPYIVYYNLLPGSFDDKALKRLADEKGLRLITIRGVIDRHSFNRDELSGIGPENFLRLIRDAEFVFTSSFHGLAFSLIFQKNFYACYRTKATRAQTLLSAVGLTDRLLTHASDSTKYDLRPIDYTVPAQLLHTYIQNSKDFLASL